MHENPIVLELLRRRGVADIHVNFETRIAGGAPATDSGAAGWQVLTNVIVPLSKPGIAIGSIFVVTLVMGDFITVRLMSGGQSASVGLMISNEISLLQYPAAAANAVVLLAVVLVMVGAILRVVDIRKEL